MTSRELAIYTAGAAHKKQQYGESPYVYHLSAVDTVLDDAFFAPDGAVRLSAWLHDVLEDSKTFTKDDIEKKFGPAVADIVWRVTNEPAANRKERALKTYPKIAMSADAVALKLADRIANLEQSARTFSRFGLMYIKEDASFTESLRPNHYNTSRLIYLWDRYDGAVAAIKAAFGMTH